MWLIVRSRTYQLSGVPNETNDDDKINYSRAPARPLDAEVLLDAICQVTGVPEAFPGAGNGQNYSGDLLPGTRAINLLRPETPSLFLDVHGRPNRLTVPERKMEGEPATGAALTGRQDLHGQAVRSPGAVATPAEVR